jgi:hypothetical protein
MPTVQSIEVVDGSFGLVLRGDTKHEIEDSSGKERGRRLHGVRSVVEVTI